MLTAATHHPGRDITHLCVGFVAHASLDGYVVLRDITIGYDISRVVDGVVAEEVREGVDVEEI